MTTINDFSLELLLDSKFFKNYNMHISSLESWGILRRDLITALGLHRAKKFLIQNGWNSGKKEAQMLKEAIQWKDKHDWLVAGTKLHVLTGRVTSYPESLYVDMEKAKFNSSGYWLDSYEAEQHSKYFPAANEPICYFLVGYASGYVSECMGKRVIFKEVTCEGKQDQYCSYKGKMLEDWGDEIEEELKFFENTDMSDELDRMYRVLEEEKEILKLGTTLSRKLTDAMLEGKGLKDFAVIFGNITNNPIKIENKHFNELANYCNMPGIETNLSARYLKENDINIEVDNEPVIYPIQHKAFKFVTTQINIRGESFGFITTIIQHQSEKMIIDLIERLADISSLFIQNKRIAIETEERVTGQLLDQLLDNESIDIAEIHHQFSLLGYDLSRKFFVLCIEFDVDTQDGESVHGKLFIGNLLKEDSDKLGYHNLLSSVKNNKAKVLISKEILDIKEMTVKEYASSILNRFKKQHINVFIGISDFTDDQSNFKVMAEEAQKAMELGKTRNDSSNVVSSNELGHLSLLLNARSPLELKKFAKEKLKPIIDHDKKNNALLLDTLYNYSQNEFNLHKTARNIHISISGMRYRLQKIEELLNKELTDSDLRFEIKLSLSILYVMGEISHD